MRQSQFVVLLDDDAMVTDGLAAGLEREDRTIVTCNDLESAELIVERFRPSHVVADIRLSGEFGFEGLDFIRYVKREAPESRVILISGMSDEALQLEAAERGAVAFLKKPFELAELDSMLEMITCSATSSAAGDARIVRMPMLEEVLASTSLRPLYQPLVALDGSGRVLGYESLARYRSDTPLRNPDILFKYAERKHRVLDLELACMDATLRGAGGLPAGHLLFLNVHPRALSVPSHLSETLIQNALRYDMPLSRLVLEITEQGSLRRSPALVRSVAELREAGVRFAFDDVGVAYSHLPVIGEIRPSFLKISQDFGTGFERDATKLKIVRNVQALARDFGCDLILEGIEQPATAQAAAGLGIPFGQGFLFGAPSEAEVLAVDFSRRSAT